MIYTLSLHDALPICPPAHPGFPRPPSRTVSAPESSFRRRSPHTAAGGKRKPDVFLHSTTFPVAGLCTCARGTLRSGGLHRCPRKSYPPLVGRVSVQRGAAADRATRASCRGPGFPAVIWRSSRKTVGHSDSPL